MSDGDWDSDSTYTHDCMCGSTETCKKYESPFPGVKGAWEQIFDIAPDCAYCKDKDQCKK